MFGLSDGSFGPDPIPKSYGFFSDFFDFRMFGADVFPAVPIRIVKPIIH